MTIAILGIFFVVAMGAGLYVAGRVPARPAGCWASPASLGMSGRLFVSARGVHAPVGYWGGLVLFAIALRSSSIS